jgi:excisionase family DNA binding protein
MKQTFMRGGVMSNDSRLLTVAQVADRMQVHPETVRGWIRAGELVAIDIGNEYRISLEDFNDFLQRRKTKKRGKKEE